MSTEITIVGNVGNDPQYNLSGAGNGWIRFNVAVYQGKNQDGSEKEAAWYTVKVFSGKSGSSFAENVRNSIQKGSRVIVQGNLETEYWDDKTTGQRRSSQTILASSVGPDLRFAEAAVTRNPREGGASAPSYGNRGGYGASAPEPVMVGIDDDGPF